MRERIMCEWVSVYECVREDIFCWKFQINFVSIKLNNFSMKLKKNPEKGEIQLPCSLEPRDIQNTLTS